MATPKKGKSAVGLTAQLKKDKKPKKTCQGSSKNTRFNSKNDKRIKKHYRGQGR